MMFPNDIINHILGEVTEKDKVHFASTCKTWMNWVINHTIFKTLVKQDIFEQSLFTFSSVILKDDDDIMLSTKRTNVTHLSLHVLNLLCHNTTFENTVDTINEHLKRFPNLKQLDLDWCTDHKIDKCNTLIIYVPEGVDTLRLSNRTNVYPNRFCITNEKSGLELELDGINYMYAGKKVILDNTQPNFVKLKSSQCTHLKSVGYSVLSDITITNLEVLECASTWWPSSFKNALCFKNLKVLTINIKTPSSYINKCDVYHSLLDYGTFPNIEVLTINGHFNDFEKIKITQSLKEINVLINSSIPYLHHMNKITSMKEKYPEVKITLIN